MMSEQKVTNQFSQLIQRAGDGDAAAAKELLPLVYTELRQLAARRMAREQPGQTLSATSLVHEAYLRLVGEGDDKAWANRAHFFSAAAEAMRRILIEKARERGRLKRGGDRARLDVEGFEVPTRINAGSLLAVDETLKRLAEEDAQAAELFKLRFFGGFSVEEAAEALGMSRASGYRLWTFARAWLQSELRRDLDVEST